MESPNFFRVGLADKHLGNYAEFELTDSISPDAVTRVALGRYLEWRLRQAGIWPAADVQVVNIEWRAASDEEIGNVHVSDETTVI
jgi:hypothetical protein